MSIPSHQHSKGCVLNTYIHISSVQHFQLATFVEVFCQMMRVYVALISLSHLSLGQGTELQYCFKSLKYYSWPSLFNPSSLKTEYTFPNKHCLPGPDANQIPELYLSSKAWNFIQKDSDPSQLSSFISAIFSSLSCLQKHKLITCCPTLIRRLSCINFQT